MVLEERLGGKRLRRHGQIVAILVTFPNNTPAPRLELAQHGMTLYNVLVILQLFNPPLPFILLQCSLSESSMSQIMPCQLGWSAATFTTAAQFRALS